jgi:hypothetical protein
LGQRIAQLVFIDASRTIPVKMPEDILPIFDVLPQTGELQAHIQSQFAEKTEAQSTSLKPIVPLRSVS